MPYSRENMVHFLIPFVFFLWWVFLSLTASELTSVHSWVCKYRFMSNQSCHSTPTWQESLWFPVLNCTITTPNVRVVFDGCHLFSIFPGCRLWSFCDCASCSVRISLVLWAPIYLIWDLVSLAVITAAVFHFLIKYDALWLLELVVCAVPSQHLPCR